MQPPAALRVDHSGKATCGALVSADGGYTRLKVNDYNAPVTLALDRDHQRHRGPDMQLT
jgi:hypothetical protein